MSSIERWFCVVGVAAQRTLCFAYLKNNKQQIWQIDGS